MQTFNEVLAGKIKVGDTIEFVVEDYDGRFIDAIYLPVDYVHRSPLPARRNWDDEQFQGEMLITVVGHDENGFIVNRFGDAEVTGIMG